MRGEGMKVSKSSNLSKVRRRTKEEGLRRGARPPRAHDDDNNTRVAIAPARLTCGASRAAPRRRCGYAPRSLRSRQGAAAAVDRPRRRAAGPGPVRARPRARLDHAAAWCLREQSGREERVIVVVRRQRNGKRIVGG